MKTFTGIMFVIILAASALPCLAQRIQPGDLVYRGAFRLPEGSNGSNWEYSGYAMTHYPGGDPQGPDDGYPGSLFAIGHDHHQMVSEINIPVPVISQNKDVNELNTAATLRGFHDITGGMFGYLEVPRAGLEYLPAQGSQATGKLHFCWGQHFQDFQASHGWCELDLSNPLTAGPWHFGGYTNYATNDYLFEIPQEWADSNTPGLRLATGRFRDGHWSGLGPALFAYGPWNEGNPPAPDATLINITPLLLYGTQEAGIPEIASSSSMRMNTFKEADEWSGGAWLTAGSKSAVILAGTKATGNNWYGFANGVVWPTDVDESTVYPEVPPWPYDDRGWWSEGINSQIIFYDTEELAAVARGTMQPYEPQPYASMDLDQYLFDPGFDLERAKRYLLGAVAFDRARGYLYIIERRADGEKGLVHVWSVSGAAGENPSPDIRANGSDGPITVSPSSPVSLTGSLDSGGQAGLNADWWLVEVAPSGIYYFDLTAGSFVSGFSNTYGGPLFDLSQTQILLFPSLAAGTHTFYFGLDTNMNGSLDVDRLLYDSVVVNVTGNQVKESFSYIDLDGFDF